MDRLTRLAFDTSVLLRISGSTEGTGVELLRRPTALVALMQSRVTYVTTPSVALNAPT
jgi:hypothetical protein